jgi:hypothetical protein
MTKHKSKLNLRPLLIATVCFVLTFVIFCVTVWFWFWSSISLGPGSVSQDEFDKFRQKEISIASQKATEDIQKAISLTGFVPEIITARSLADTCYKDSRGGGGYFIAAYEKNCTQRQVVAVLSNKIPSEAMTWLELKFKSVGLQSEYTVSERPNLIENCYGGTTRKIDGSNMPYIKDSHVSLYFTIMGASSKNCIEYHPLNQNDTFWGKSEFVLHTINKKYTFNLDTLRTKALRAQRPTIILLAFDKAYFSDDIKVSKTKPD